MKIISKLPQTQTSIFAIMSGMANKYKAINLSQGFPNFKGSQKMMDDVNHFIQEGYNQYAPMPGINDLRIALANKVQKLYRKTINADEEITITAGATQALFTAICAFVKPGDEVIIIEPAYDCYAPAIKLNGGIAIPYAIIAPDYKIDWSKIKSLINKNTKMIMINTPHNPTGTILEQDDLQNLDKLTRDTVLTYLATVTSP